MWSAANWVASAERRSSHPRAASEGNDNGGLLGERGGHGTAGAHPRGIGERRHECLHLLPLGANSYGHGRTAGAAERVDYGRPAMRRNVVAGFVAIACALPVVSAPPASSAAPDPGLFVVADS